MTKLEAMPSNSREYDLSPELGMEIPDSELSEEQLVARRKTAAMLVRGRFEHHKPIEPILLDQLGVPEEYQGDPNVIAAIANHHFPPLYR